MWPPKRKVPPQAVFEASEYSVTDAWCSVLHWKQSFQSSRNRQYSISARRLASSLTVGREEPEWREIALKTSRTYNLEPGIARLKEITFPEKRWSVFRLRKGDVRISSLNVANLIRVSWWMRKAWRTESHTKPRKHTQVAGVHHARIYRAWLPSEIFSKYGNGRKQ